MTRPAVKESGVTPHAMISPRRWYRVPVGLANRIYIDKKEEYR
jgi:hypothetical protein